MVQVSFIRRVLNWKTYSAIAVILLSLFIVWHNAEVAKAYERGKAVTKAEYIIQIDKLNRETDARISLIEKSMNIKVSSIQKEKDIEIVNTTNKYNSIIAGLQQRVSRKERNPDTGNSSNAESIKRCTGKELYREDAEFLAGESARAEEIRINLLACYKQYDAVKYSLEGISKE